MKSSFVFGGGGSSGSRGTGNPSFNRSRSRVASQSVRRQDRTICPRRSAPWIPSASTAYGPFKPDTAEFRLVDEIR